MKLVVSVLLAVLITLSIAVAASAEWFFPERLVGTKVRVVMIGAAGRDHAFSNNDSLVVEGLLTKVFYATKYGATWLVIDSGERLRWCSKASIAYIEVRKDDLERRLTVEEWTALAE